MRPDVRRPRSRREQRGRRGVGKSTLRYPYGAPSLRPLLWPASEPVSPAEAPATRPVLAPHPILERPACGSSYALVEPLNRGNVVPPVSRPPLLLMTGWNELLMKSARFSSQCAGTKMLFQARVLL